MCYLAVNGLDMYHEVRGDGPPLLLLHGGSGSIPETWIPFFTPRFRVVAPEQIAVTGANARFDGYTARNQEWVVSLDPDSQPVSDDYARLSPDGAGHWPVLLGRLQPMWANEPSFTEDELESIEAPTLLIFGDRDIVTPEHAVEMFRTIPRAQLCVVPNAGHGVMPNETVLAFLQEEAPSEN